MLNGVRFLAQIIIDRYFTNRTSNRDILRFCRMHRISFHLFGIVLYTTECLAPLVLHTPNTNSALHSFGQLKSVLTNFQNTTWGSSTPPTETQWIKLFEKYWLGTNRHQIQCEALGTKWWKEQSLEHSGESDIKQHPRASLVAQWLRIHLPMQGTRVRALVQEDPTCRGATKPVHHNY